MSKENIIANILSAAEAEKEETLKAAREKAEAIGREDDAYCDALRAKTAADAERDEKTAIERSVTVGGMDVRKMLLAEKQEKISEVFRLAEGKILGMADADYERFILSLVSQHAEDGDTVVLAASDAGRVSAGAVVAAAAAKGAAVTCRADGDFSGGVMLEGKVYDKNLTLRMILREYREKNEPKIAAMLAGE